MELGGKEASFLQPKYGFCTLTATIMQCVQWRRQLACGPLLTEAVSLSLQHYFTVNFTHENQKALELRTEDAKDCDEWVAAIAHARYVSPNPRTGSTPPFLPPPPPLGLEPQGSAWEPRQTLGRGAG